MSYSNDPGQSLPQPIPGSSISGHQSLLQRESAARRPPGVITKLLHHSGAVVGMAILSIVIVMAVAAPLLAPTDPTASNIINRLEPPSLHVEGHVRHLLGTDQLGRDLLSRIIYGARVSLLVGGVSVLLAGALGVALGLAAGYFGGRIDNLIMRIADVQMAFPFILLALVIVAVLGAGVRNLILVFSITGWVVYARTVRGSVLSVREMEYVRAAQAIGASNIRILTVHVLRNVLSPLIVIASFELAKIIIYEASLSFLGLGVQPPTPSWGSMLADGRGYVQTAWWIGIFPGVMLMVTVLGVNFIGDALRDILDPNLREV